MNKLLSILLVPGFQILAARDYMPIPDNLKSSCHFDFEKNFLYGSVALEKTKTELGQQMMTVNRSIREPKHQEFMVAWKVRTGRPTFTFF